jgi:probable HAF family extracellular repeat protein
LAQNSDPTKTHATVWQTGQGPTSLGTLGGQKSTAYAITEDGRIVGQANTVGVPLVTHAFYYENGIMNDLGTLPGGNFSSAQGINSAGVIVGFAAPSGNTPQHAFRYVGGQMQDLGTLGGADSKAYAINEKGHIVGSSQLANGERHATLYIRDTWKDLGTLGGITSEAFAINDSTWIVGTSLNASGESRAFLWKGGFMHDLNTVVQGSGWVFTEARGINNKGQIVGVGISPNDEKHAFLITPDVTEGLGASRLADLVTASRLQTHADIVTPAPVGASRSAPAATPAASVPLAQDAKPATVTNAPNRALSRVVATTSADALVGASVLRLEVAISSRV